MQDKTLDLFLLTLILGALFFIIMGTPPLFIPDGARYAEIGREMALSQDYITPHLNGVKYFEKPILFYWLTALVIHWAGLNLWALHSINALFAILGGLLTYLAASTWFGRTTGFLAALILGSSTLYFSMGHIFNLDISLTVLLTASLYAFLIGTQAEKNRRLYITLAFVLAALATLTKGMIGLLFPIMIAGTWILFLNDWKLLKRLYLPSSFLIFLMIAAPWHILVGLHNPEFFKFYFIEQQFFRYTTFNAGHYQSVWYFIPILIVGFFPWITFLPQAMLFHKACFWQKRHEHPVEFFLLLWALIIFIFFSFSKSKLISYILPVLPPISILTAHYLAQCLKLKNGAGIKWGFATTCLLSIVFASFCFFYTVKYPVPHPSQTRFYLYSAGIILLAGSILGNIYAWKNKNRAALITLFITMSLFLLAIFASIPYLNRRTTEPLAMTLKPILTPQDEVMTYHDYFQDLPFYLERRITIVGWKNELAFGSKHQNTTDWIIDEKTFWQRFNSQKRVFVILDNKRIAFLQSHYPNLRVYVWNKTLSNTLISNEKPRYI